MTMCVFKPYQGIKTVVCPLCSFTKGFACLYQYCLSKQKDFVDIMPTRKQVLQNHLKFSKDTISGVNSMVFTDVIRKYILFGLLAQAKRSFHISDLEWAFYWLTIRLILLIQRANVHEYS